MNHDKIIEYDNKGIENMSNSFRERYQLRYAAGCYWLLDMTQPGVPYKKPLPLNKTGADIWKKTEAGLSLDAIAESMSSQFGVPVDEMKQDVENFYRQLEECGIVL